MQPLYSPSEAVIRQTRMDGFRRRFEGKLGIELDDYAALHEASVAHKEAFWPLVWGYCHVVGNPGSETLMDADLMPGATWFPNATLNFAENLLRRQDNDPAIVFRGEDKVHRNMSWAQLYDAVSQTAQALKNTGVGPGDRIAAFMPNMPETVIAMLAASSLGAIWSSCSPDFGVEGVIDRFGQIEPTVLFAVDGYFYKGQTHNCLEKVRNIVERLPTLNTVVVVPYVSSDHDMEAINHAIYFDDFLAQFPASPMIFERFSFNHPLYILFSSGTTGTPKCIVHSAGGTLLQHLKEHQLHTDIKPGDRLFYFTTCGWMMWNWLISGLASGATLLLYDGNPFHPTPEVLFDYAAEEGCTVFGTSAKYIEEIKKLGLTPARTHELNALQVMLSTGSPLTDECFDYVYRDIKSELRLSSISGGTDIVSCFVLGCPLKPVFRGEIQCAGLGMAVKVFNETGDVIKEHKGELVCTEPFPSMPVGFWNDPVGDRYRAAYFERFPGIWHHGDYASETANGGFIIYGRSDTVLNPGGVRIGTAEIYRQVDLQPDVLESLVIGQEWQGDVRIILFVRVKEGVELDALLKDQIKQRIRQNTTPRHVPAKVISVPDIPRTRSGKLVEIAVRDIVHGRDVTNLHAIANPEALTHFSNLKELAE